MYKKRIFLVLVLIFFITQSIIAAPDYESARREMVTATIKARGVEDPRVLAVMEKVPRHEYVPERWRFLAYADRPLPIEAEQTISQPYIVALMTELLVPKPTDKVLEIGAGSGYQAAVLAELVKEVYTIEIIPELAQSAEKRLQRLGYKNIYIKCGDGYYGWPEKGPFDGIIVTCGAPKVPPALFEQLKEGGRMVIPVGSPYFSSKAAPGEAWGKGYQKLMLIRKKNGKMVMKFVTDVVFVPLVGDH